MRGDFSTKRNMAVRRSEGSPWSVLLRCVACDSPLVLVSGEAECKMHLDRFRYLAHESAAGFVQMMCVLTSSITAILPNKIRSFVQENRERKGEFRISRCRLRRSDRTERNEQYI